MNPVLEFKSVSIRYAGRLINTVSNITFHVHPDERVALFGLNGSGKTSLLLAAVGLVPFSGSIFIDSTAVEKKSLQQIRGKTGFLFNIPEDQILFPRVLDDVAYGMIRQGMPAESAHEKSLAMLSALGLSEIAQYSPFQLSHGQRQRIALAGTLVTNPKVVLLDEPSSALDPKGRLSLANVLCSINSSFLIATHDTDFAAKTCSRFLVLHDGVLRECRECNEVEKILLDETRCETDRLLDCES
jgi:energy-coupling factor transporter ATP-binding protein EcfA2